MIGGAWDPEAVEPSINQSLGIYAFEKQRGSTDCKVVFLKGNSPCGALPVSAQPRRTSSAVMQTGLARVKALETHSSTAMGCQGDFLGQGDLGRSRPFHLAQR